MALKETVVLIFHCVVQTPVMVVVSATKRVIVLCFNLRDLVKNEWWPYSPDWGTQSTWHEANQSVRHLGGPI